MKPSPSKAPHHAQRTAVRGLTQEQGPWGHRGEQQPLAYGTGRGKLPDMRPAAYLLTMLNNLLCRFWAARAAGTWPLRQRLNSSAITADIFE